jgi:hypothetical protein
MRSRPDFRHISQSQKSIGMLDIPAAIGELPPAFQTSAGELSHLTLRAIDLFLASSVPASQ